MNLVQQAVNIINHYCSIKTKDAHMIPFTWSEEKGYIMTLICAQILKKSFECFSFGSLSKHCKC